MKELCCGWKMINQYFLRFCISGFQHYAWRKKAKESLVEFAGAVGVVYFAKKTYF